MACEYYVPILHNLDKTFCLRTQYSSMNISNLIHWKRTILILGSVSLITVPDAGCYKTLLWEIFNFINDSRRHFIQITFKNIIHIYAYVCMIGRKLKIRAHNGLIQKEKEVLNNECKVLMSDIWSQWIILNGTRKH